MQGNNSWIDVRMFYTKTGLAKYISHLDTVRCLSRAMKRAAVPIWFTEGFNPHAFLTFAMPLSLGVESYCETVDFRLTEEADLTELAERLNATLPEGISVKKIAVPKFKASDIRYAEYEIVFNDPNESLIAKAHTLLASEEIMAEKKAKQGRKKVTKEINIKEHIKTYELSQKDGKLILKTVLSSGTLVNINPMLLISAIVKDTDIDERDADITKIQSYTENMEIFR